MPAPAGLARSYLYPALPCCCDNQSSAPLGLVWFPFLPAACAVGCILTPLAAAPVSTAGLKPASFAGPGVARLKPCPSPKTTALLLPNNL